MSYKKDDLFNTSLPTLIIEKEKRYKEYVQKGYGDEGSVFQYDEKIAFKTFEFISDEYKLIGKFEKIEFLGKITDPSACFPKGLVGYEDRKKEGYYYELVNYLKNCKDFDYLQFLKSKRKVIEYIVKADEAIQRFHKLGFILGDIKGENIMIDCDENVKFVDTDNWMYKEYGFDINPSRASWLNNTFNKDFSLVDNDRFVFAMLAIQLFVNVSIISLPCSDNYLKKLIEFMDVSQEIKDGLRLIFSDAQEKPYVGPILKKINPEQEILSKDAVYKLNRIF